MLNNLDLHKLRVIAYLVESESVRATADQIGVSSSAISQTVKSVEDQLGRQLFLRVGKKLISTPLAKEISQRTKTYFDDLSLLLERQEFMPEELTIGAPSLFGKGMLTELICGFQKQDHRVRIHLSLNDTHQNLKALSNGDLDFAFVDETPALKSHQEIDVTDFVTEELVMCGSIGFLKSNRISVQADYASLKQVEHVLYHRGKEGVHKWYMHHFGKVPDLKSFLSIDQPEAVLEAIRRGQGLGVVPASLVENSPARSQFIVLKGKKASLKSRICVAQLKSKIPSRTEKALLKYLRMSTGARGNSL